MEKSRLGGFPQSRRATQESYPRPTSPRRSRVSGVDLARAPATTRCIRLPPHKGLYCRLSVRSTMLPNLVRCAETAWFQTCREEESATRPDRSAATIPVSDTARRTSRCHLLPSRPEPSAIHGHWFQSLPDRAYTQGKCSMCL